MMLRRSIAGPSAARLLPKRAPAPSQWSRFSSTGPSRPVAEAAGAGNGSLVTKGLLAAFAVTAVGYFAYQSVGAGSSAQALRVPLIGNHKSDSAIPVKSPVQVVDLETANARLRQDVHSFAFDTAQGKAKGRVDVVRFSSNNPVEDEWDVAAGKGVDGNETLFFGVYDGHAGWATSKLLKQALVPHVSVELSQLTSAASGELLDSAVKKAFLRLDDRITKQAIDAIKAGYKPGAAEVISAIAPAIAGSCALLSIYDPAASSLRTAVTGDSRAVRGEWSQEGGKYKTDVLSRDQTGFNEDEVNRIDREHPGEKEKVLSPESGRLLGLAVTRAFGDHRWKWSKEDIETAQEDFYGTKPRPDYKTPPYMSAEPEVTTRKVQTKDFVILASDGLWDMMTNEDAVACVTRWLAAVKAGKPEPVKETEQVGGVGEGWTATPEHFAIEDMDNAAVCLVKNALGGSRRKIFLGAMTTYAPLSRNVRDDMTVQVVFFEDPRK